MRKPETTDGVDFLEIGPTAQTALGRYLHYYDATPKQLPDGRGFNLYAGLCQYLITKGDCRALLHAETTEALWQHKRRRWINVENLKERLVEVVVYNLSNTTSKRSLLPDRPLPVIWSSPDSELKRAEKRWIIVVYEALQRLCG